MNNFEGNPLHRPFVQDGQTLILDTYKYHWIICRETGNAYSVEKDPSLFRRLSQVRKRQNDSYSIYDYFTAPNHIQWSLDESKKVVQEVLNRHAIDIKGRRILDISGGNGHVADELRKLGAEVVLTEVNDKAIEYARNNLKIETVKFDFQESKLSNVVTGKFDVVLLRAAIMFCVDVEGFLADLKRLLMPGAIIVMQYCVTPTLGVLLRTQDDEYNYLALYQPDTLVEYCIEQGLRLIAREDEIDADPYVFDHDYSRWLTLLRIWYEVKGLRVLPFTSKYHFRARDRRRSNMIFKYEPGDPRKA
ncbi:MAG: class I SAM-dependent methyltransferase [Anaerolineales bacterium]|nr:class I SAM-dependent methyltransferase [Anaerolineales bacterium]